MKTAFRIIFIIIINALLLLQINAQTPGLIIKPGEQTVFDPNNDGYISVDEFGFISDDLAESELAFVSIATVEQEPTQDPKGPACHFNDIVDTGSEEPIMVRNDGTNFMVRFRQSTTVDNAKGYALLIDADGLFGAAEEGVGYSSSNPGFEIELTLLTKFGVYLNNIDNKSKGTVGGRDDGYYSDLDIQSPVSTRFQKSIAVTNNCGDIDIFYEFYVPVADIEAAYPGFSTSLIRIVGLTTLNPLPTMGQANWSDLGGIDDTKYGNFEEIFNELIAVNSPTDPDDLDGSDPAALRYSECPDINSVNTLTSIISGSSSEADGSIINIYKNAVLLNTTTISGGAWSYDATLDGLVAGDIITATALGINKKESSGCSNDQEVIACLTIPDPPIVTGTAPAEKGMIGTYSGAVTLPSTPEIDLYRIGFGVINDATWNDVSWTAGSPSNWVKDRGAGSIDYGIYYAQAVGLSCESLPGSMYCYSKAGKGFDTPISITPTITVATQESVSGTISGASTNNTTIYLYEETNVGSGVYHLLGTTGITAGNTTWAFSGLNISQCKNVKVYFVEPNIANTCQSESGAVQIGGSSTTAPVITDNGDCAPTAGTVITIEGTSLEQKGTIIKLYKNGSGTAEAQTGLVNADGSWYIGGVSVAGNDYLKATATQDNACSFESPLSALQYDISLATPNTASIDVSLSDDAIAYRESDTDVTVSFSSAFTGTARLYIDQELIGQANLFGSTSSNFILPYTDINGDEISLYAGGELTVTLDDGTNCESVHSFSETVQCTPPTNTLTLSPDPSKVCYNEKGNFTIENTQAFVVYTPVKVSDGSVIGYSTLSTSDGSNINVNTHNLTVDPTDITVDMMKISRFICESTNSNNITFNVNSELTAGTSTATDPTCATGSNGEIVASASGGSGTGYEYQLDGGAWQASPTFSNLAAGTYTVSIKDDELCADDQTDVILADGVGACSINISIDDVSLQEGNSGITAFDFTVSLDAAYGVDITIDYITNHSGINPTDAADRSLPSGTITVLAGETTAIITVDVNGDTDVEPSETFTVDLSNASFGTITDSQGLGIISNDDAGANNPPLIPDATVSTDEDVANAAAVHDVDDSNTSNDTDLDGDPLTYSITAGNADGIFAINASTGAITVLDNTNLDYETATQYVLTVQATDGTDTDNATITVNINNVNDNNPLIPDATVSIDEDAANAAAVHDVDDTNTSNDTDADGQALSYSITAGNADGVFTINASTGAITVLDNTNLDYESTTQYVLTVQATDGTNTDNATITVNINNVNDNNPLIPDATVSIDEDAANAAAVHDVDDTNTSNDTDADGQALTYSITAGNADGVFTINASTGTITVIDNSTLDYETTTQYVLTVQATDGTNTDNATITVNINNVNDNDPLIPDATVSIDEDAANAAAVHDVDDTNTSNDTDADGQALTYSITAGNGDGVFAINASTGAITVSDNSNLDYESTTQYVLTVQATDGTNTDNATITVNINNINDNNPVIPDATVSIDEDAANTTAVHDVDDTNTSNDTDADGQALTYSITAGNGDGVFAINASTGAITVSDNTNLDYESTTQYVLTVQATDGTNTDNATITVNINNVNDNNPLIPDATVSIDEDAANAAAVHDVDDTNTSNDTDADGQALTYSITAGNGDGVFAINASTGAITVLDNTNLDYESTIQYVLTVQAIDGTNTDNATITVDINNVNDNNPLIPDATVSIDEDAANATAVHDVDDSNTSNDSDADGQALTYSITAGNADGVFAINASTGAITVLDNANLDYESTTQYVLTVQVTDGTNTDNATITVNINNVNDNNPLILDATVSIDEDAANATAVHDVDDTNTSNDTDADGQALTYSIIAGNGDGVFAINASTGAITVLDNTNLDYESTTQYVLTVQATDGTNTDNATITVNINDVAENGPSISDNTVSIAEDSANGTSVDNVNDSNTGNDTDVDGQAITYSITSGNVDGIFTIDVNTGAITVLNNTNLDYETTTQYVLTIQGEDTDANTNTGDITINITNVNDNNPLIPDATVSIDEDAANAAAVHDVDDTNTSNDTDLDEDVLTYSITAGNADGVFAIDASTGAITVTDNSTLDYESTTQYVLTVQATDGTNTDNATITVNINNVNDNNPLIPDATVSIDEDAANAAAVHDVDDSNTSNDTDADGQALTYSITAGNADGVFAINASTGAITVLDNTNLDYESTTQYVLTVQATDGTNTDNATITVDINNINDNNPLIPDATVSIDEDAANAAAVHDVDDSNTSNDTDADGQALTYSITAGNADGVFAINASTGAITVLDNTNLDYESTTQYVLTVQATDGTNTDNATITVDINNINDNNPLIPDATVSIDEDAANATAVHDVDDSNTSNDTDADGQALTYSITAGNADGVFAINASTGAITVLDNTNLDYESTTQYVLTVQATDGTNTDNATITVNINDIAENGPSIADNTVSIAEDSANGTSVDDVNDSNTGNDKDSDGQTITYSITSGNVDGIFTIDVNTGAITVLDNTNLDYETTIQYVLTIQAEDPDANTNTGDITINITNVNDNNPLISDATVSIDEDAANATAVHDVDDSNTSNDTDLDEDALTYSITAGNADGVFAINASTGAITVTDNSTLDYETTIQYVLTVQATDGTNTDNATITVNINDIAENSPSIADNTVSIAEDSANGTSVDDVNDSNTGNDTDNDGQAITYLITLGNADGIFTIDLNTGAITVLDNTNLDYETTTQYVLTVQAEDSDGNTDDATITVNIIDVAENGPSISDYTTSISEDTGNGTSVYDVDDDNTGNDTDNDGQAITYLITSGNADGIFTIDLNTGAISVLDNTNLDYETTTQYVLTVQAEDSDGNTDDATITVNIIDVAENGPAISDYTTSISEDTGNGTLVYDVDDDNTGNDTDNDGQAITYSITSGNADGIFAIDANTGAITVLDITNLDYETTTQYVLTVQAEDSDGNTDDATITVNITDVAEDGPAISDYTTLISEDTGNGTLVYDVDDDNTGNDTDNDGQAITYIITSGNADGIFTIDASTGAITVLDNTNLDYETTTQYVLTVQAEDSDGNTDDATITVNITDVAENDPAISDYTTSISEDTGNGTLVYDVDDDNTGNDTDNDGQAITYIITSGNADGIFTIDASTGAITVLDNTNLDYETTTQYVLTVQAEDSDGNTDDATITVNIIDVAENGPSISDYTTSISEDTGNGTSVYDVDDDNTGNDTDNDGQAITYSITSGNADGIFTIDANTGAITVLNNTNLDYETTTQYVLTVQAEDSDGNTDDAFITVNIIDEIAELIIPEGFSPGDGQHNEEFYIEGLDSYDKASINIYNRWGNLVYTDSNYKNDWTGTNNVNTGLGQELPSGTYYYLLEIKDNGKTYNGSVYLKRMNK